MIILLSESHASIHTYPEHGGCFVDFFTCGTTCKPENFDKYMQNYLKPKNIGIGLLLNFEAQPEFKPKVFDSLRK